MKTKKIKVRQGFTVVELMIAIGVLTDVLVFDEIGDCPDARATIKYILKETNFDLIATGSLLGVKGFKNRQNRSPSVGSNNYITMYPMDFKEFPWANGLDDSIIGKIKSAIKAWTPLDGLYHQRFAELFKHYVICGGMPEAVIQYIETHDFAKVLATNKNKAQRLTRRLRAYRR